MEYNILKALHEMHHMGVERTLFSASKVKPQCLQQGFMKSSENVNAKIDPALSVHEVGEIWVKDIWERC